MLLAIALEINAEGIAAVIGSLATFLLAWDQIKDNRETRRKHVQRRKNAAKNNGPVTAES